MKRVGIYAGTFDPVHTGHIAFALQAMERARLDELYFVPERKPRRKQGVEHFGHRVAMLNRAVEPHPKFEILEINDIQLSVKRTLTNLQMLFTDSQLVFLFGSDAARHLPEWPYARALLESCELAVSVRAEDDMENIKASINDWDIQPKALHIFDSYAPKIASSKIREALRANQDTPGALSSVKRYSNQNWLYVSVGG